MSGLGGTHWGRVEGGRSVSGSIQARAAQTFRNWGISTVDSVRAAVAVVADAPSSASPSVYEVWASGGVRSGLDAAKLLALGATHVGLAQPILQAAMNGEEELDQTMATLEFEMKTAMFCTGSQSVAELRGRLLSNAASTAAERSMERGSVR